MVIFDRNFRTAFAATLLATAFQSSPTLAAQLDIREFGARADDGRDDSAAIERALRRARPGDTVRIPTGVFDVSRAVRMSSGVTLAGQGCGRSVLRRTGQSGQIMFRFEGVQSAAVRGIEFSYNGAPQFYRAIGFRGRGSSNITVSDNCFFERNFRGGRGDRWAIELSATDSPSRNITITGNEVRGNVQLTAGGGAGVIGARIAYNRVINARANAIAISTLGDRVEFRDIAITNNTIETPTAIGVFIGPDQPSAAGGRFSNITIANNRITGFRNRYTYGIFLRAPIDGMSSVTITGNEIDGRGSAEPIAIRLLDDHGRGTRRFSDVRICSNAARNVGRGVWLQRVFGARLADNRMQTSRPLIAASDENRDIVTTDRC
ncbi:glycosyl hydrolase family 28-related protein [Aurantiacibacter aquimixticola]|uniref:Rhamnogalacturonase A/B/Epimerase-like pectate lyase domain-containing protein n=1 Tax=Aurantiacibacter aquimixticola TaxID=1958945 RepID=A0A419RSH6_9SPHN|nr:glycosyl hydrolase family 28-related protein [Aurantiacibacter aquimixticola]RJY08737.1 hypothetical protein D6201_04630 [Aurantiacibacter aquimixticola]